MDTSELPFFTCDRARAYLKAAQSRINDTPVMIRRKIPYRSSSEPRQLLMAELSSGAIDRALRIHDEAQGWHNFYTDNADFLPMEGTIAIPDAQISMTPISGKNFLSTLSWLVSVRGIYIDKRFSKTDREITFNSMHDALFKDNQSGIYLGTLVSCNYWRLTPDFLFAYSDTDPPDGYQGQVPFFDREGENMAFLVVGELHYLLLLVSTYPPLPEMDSESDEHLD